MKKRASDTKQNRRRINVRKVMHRDQKKNIHTEGTHGRPHTSQAHRSGKQKY